MGAQDSCLKVVLSATVHSEMRGRAFGVFETGSGVGWCAVQHHHGLLYDRSILAVILFFVVLQLLALPLLAMANRKKRQREMLQDSAV